MQKPMRIMHSINSQNWLLCDVLRVTFLAEEVLDVVPFGGLARSIYTIF